MRIPFSFLFLALVLGEIAGFVLVGEAIGVLGTLGLVLLGMVAGVALLRHHGVETLMRVRSELAANRPPARPLAEGAILALASLLIILPGFLTDIAGVLLFVPLVREGLWRRFKNKVEVRSAHAGRPSASRGGVVDLDQSEYGEAATGRAHPDSPWRLGNGPEA